MSGPIVDASRIREHVVRLGEKYPPIDLATVDYHVVNPRQVLDRFAHSLEFMARVEMEVERNVLELAIMLPDVSETDRLFYADVWSPQEVHHGVVLDTLGQKLGLPPTAADLTTIVPSVRVLGALSHLPMIHEIIRLLYYLTGAATEKSAILAYNAMSDGLTEMGETAIKKTVIDAIKVQEPGHFAFYRMSALEMVQQKVLAPWQLHLAGFLRSRAFSLVGAYTKSQKTTFGGVLVELGLEAELEATVRDVVRIEHQLLWAQKEGMRVPKHALRAFRDSVELYRSRSALRAA
jgi:hypothetical protein